MPQVSSTVLIAVARSLLSLSFGEGGDLDGVIFRFCSEDKITSFQEEKKKVYSSAILSMSIARLNVGNHSD